MEASKKNTSHEKILKVSTSQPKELRDTRLYTDNQEKGTLNFLINI